MQMPYTQEDRDKVLRLLEVIGRLARMRQKPVHDLAKFEEVVWLGDIPEVSQVPCILQAAPDARDRDVWLSVKAYEEPLRPPEPAGFSTIVDAAALADPSTKPGPLASAAPPGFSARVWSDLAARWQSYIADSWTPWAAKHQAWRQTQALYNSLFTIHHALRADGDSLEFVLGIGLLVASGPVPLRRHVVVADAEISHDSARSRFVVRAGPRGARFRTEVDFLDGQVAPGIEADLRDELADLADDEWTASRLHQALQAFTHGLASDAVYAGSASCPADELVGRIRVTFAPALILRKRSERGLTEAISTITRQISEGGGIPLELARLAELDPGDGSLGARPAAIEMADPLFPKPANEEQIRIAERITSNTGILVQGPPGTGKTHTIANLICHLLANDKRVLITAKTQRALQSLHDKLPDQIKPLCISLIGEGRAQRESIEASVGRILAEDDIGAARHHRSALAARKRRDESRQASSMLRQSMLEYRAAEAHRVSIADGTYVGTAASVAAKLDNDRPEYDWLKDSIAERSVYPLADMDWSKLLTELRWCTPDVRRVLGRHIAGAAVPPDDLDSTLSDMGRTQGDYGVAVQHADPDLLLLLRAVSDEAFESLKAAVLSLVNTVDRKQVGVGWDSRAIQEILAGGEATWRTRRDRTRPLLESAAELLKLDTGGYVLEASRDRVVARADANAVRTHLEAGGRLGWWVFRPPTVRNRLYIITEVRLDGAVCHDGQSLRRLENSITLDLTLEEAWQLWTGILDERVRSPHVLHDELQSALVLLADLLDLCKPRDQANRQWSANSLGALPCWSDSGARQSVRWTLDADACRRHLERLQSRLDRWIAEARATADRPDAHPVNSQLADSLEAHDLAAYRRAYNAWIAARQDRARMDALDEQMRQVRSAVPLMADDLAETPQEGSWSARLAHLRGAWNWSRGCRWLRGFCAERDTEAVSSEYARSSQQYASATSELAASLAWSSCLSALKSDSREHMVAWQQAVNRLGKGTGKHAPYWRRMARKHLDKCSAAVPAWVMPLHRVWDTVPMAPGAFDVVIVDEASQCEFDALILTYMAPIIIVVGDNKQVSPEGIGIDQQKVMSFVREAIPDFSHSDSFDPLTSLYDHAQRRFHGHISLLEHFRCMPEIIAFSNELSYPNKPLVPLRQYGPERLPPLRHTHVADGLTVGSDASIVNQAEAEAVVDAVVSCCRDSAYDNLTFGVITLQGQGQAKLIISLLMARAPSLFSERDLVVGDPSAFQGDERDVIFLSLVTAPNRNAAALTTDTHKRRFNVAASRAKDQMWLFHSVTVDDLSPECVRRQLIMHFIRDHSVTIAGVNVDDLRSAANQKGRSQGSQPKPFDSWFEVDVALALAERGFAVTPQFPVGAKKIDIVVFGSGGQSLAIECDGDVNHGPDDLDADWDRQRQLERVGWVFHRIRQSQFYQDREASIGGAVQALAQRGITPRIETEASTASPPRITDQSDECQEDTSTTVQATDERRPQSSTPPKHAPRADAPSTSGAATEWPGSPYDQVGWAYSYREVDDPDAEIVNVTITEALGDPRHGTINHRTAVAAALLGGRPGQRVRVNSPDPFSIEIVTAAPPPGS